MKHPAFLPGVIGPAQISGPEQSSVKCNQKQEIVVPKTVLFEYANKSGQTRIKALSVPGPYYWCFIV